jgi:hypothetical protein
MTAEQRVFPIQTQAVGRRGESGGVPESVYMAAYEVYSHIHGAQPAMIDLEGRGCRGGFSTGELIAFLYARPFPKDQWRDRVNEAFQSMRGFS